MGDPKKLKVFYAWQSDLPDATNRRAIRTALQTAGLSLEHDHSAQDLRIIIDEATRDVPGSPNIPQEILEKISASDIFVCDVTPINAAADGQTKKTPNPNVVFELGYAVSQLGWPRIVMMFNDAFAVCPDDLPFDVSRHRVSRYRMAETEDNRQSRDKLTSVAKDALEGIIKASPLKPTDLKNLKPEEVRRRRDVKIVRWVLETLHWPTLGNRVQHGPKIITDSFLHFWESFNGVFTSKQFHLYDRKLFAHFRKLHQLWEKLLSYSEFYIPSMKQDIHIFTTGDAGVWTRQHREAWREIETCLPKFDRAMNGLLEYLRKNYLGIDIDEASTLAWNSYLAELAELDEKFKDS
jgi:hypothetical protein